VSEFTEHLNEVFERFGPITARKMFGGFGIYHDGLMFALVADDTLYLKADHESAGRFEREGLGRFEYDKQGKRVKMSFYQAPAHIFDDRDEAAVWARLAFAAALRSRAAQRRARPQRQQDGG
jgi:DNA transformation protein